MRGPIYQVGYKPQFSGHETFPLRYGWLKKAYDAVRATEDSPDNKSVFLGDDAIASFGVGKNMVGSMRHWASAAGIIKDGTGNSIITTPVGRKLFGARGGLDPYMEHPATLWLIHWHLAGRPDRTTWYWAFNYFPSPMFERHHLVRGLEKLAGNFNWSRVAASTLKRDVDCFVRTYAAYSAEDHSDHEDSLESPLIELGLIKAVGKRDGFRFARGPKASLGAGVFTYALIDFWSQQPSRASAICFEALAYEPGSPGRVFLLEENDLADRLMAIDDITGGDFRWSETSGLKQIIRRVDFGKEEPLRYIVADYAAKDKEAA